MNGSTAVLMGDRDKSKRELLLRLPATKEDIPNSGIIVDATQPLVIVVDEIPGAARVQA
jgi:hypothetical protein